MARLSPGPIVLDDAGGYSRQLGAAQHAASILSATAHVYGYRGRILVPSQDFRQAGDRGQLRNSPQRVGRYYFQMSETERPIAIVATIQAGMIGPSTVVRPLFISGSVDFDNTAGNSGSAETQALGQQEVEPLSQLGIPAETSLEVYRGGQAHCGEPATVVWEVTPNKNIGTDLRATISIGADVNNLARMVALTIFEVNYASL